MNSVNCPGRGCGLTLAVTPQMLGRILRCPKCKQQFRVPAPTATPLPAALSQANPSIQASVPHPPAAPRQIGRFQIRAHLGAGGFGTVYRAYDPQLDREVALKVALPGTLNDPARRERFLREARASAQLRHPHIIPLFEAGAEPTPYLASAYVEGRTLDADLCGKPMEVKKAVRIVRELAEALAYAHGLGIVHRDVKPANVMLDARDEPHLLDFGLAHRQEGEEKLTREGDLLGTPAYMAPELVTAPEGDIQPATDQYALGVVLYELLTGQTPFEGPAEVVLYQAINNEVPPPSRGRPGLARDLDTICLKAMARQPAERYASCQELADDLRRWLEGEPIKARPIRWWERSWRWAKRKPALAASLTALAVLFLVAGVSLIAMLSSRRQTSVQKNRADQAEIGRKQAEGKSQQAVQKSKQAEQKQEKADLDKYWTQYATDIREEAPKLWQANENSRLVSLLKEYDPQKLSPNKRALVSFEWHYWWHRCHHDRLAISVESPVREVSLSHDGKLVAGLNRKEELLIWDAASGKRLGVLPARARAFAFSPTQLQLAVNTSADDCVSMYDVVLEPKSGQVEFKLLWKRNTDSQGQRIIQAIAFSPDGQRVAAAEPSLPVWDAESGRLIALVTRLGWRAGGNLAGNLHYPSAHKGLVHAVAFNGNGKLLASGGADGIVKVWDVTTGAVRQKFSEHKGPVTTVAFSPNGQHMASASTHSSPGGADFADFAHLSGAVLVWDISSKKIVWRFSRHSQAVGPREGDFPLTFSRDGTQLLSPSDAGMQVWDVVFGTPLFEIKGHTGRVLSARFSPQGEIIVSSSADSTIRIWPATSPDAETVVRDGKFAAGVVFARGSPPVFPGGSFGPLREFACGEEKAILWRQVGACGSGNGQRLAARLHSGETHVWDAATGRVLQVFPKSGDNKALALSPDGRLLARGDTLSIHIEDVDQGKEVQVLTRAVKRKPTVADPLHGSLIPKSPDDFLDGVHWPGGLAFSPDGKRLAAVGHDEKGGKVWLWQINGGEAKGQVLTRHTGVVLSVAFSPDGRLLASGGADGVVQVWNLAENRELHRLQGHREPISHLLFSPDGRRLASFAGHRIYPLPMALVKETKPDQAEAKLWNPHTGDHLLDLPCGASAYFQGVAFSSDSRLLSATVVTAVRLPVAHTGPDMGLKQRVSIAEVRVWNTSAPNTSKGKSKPE